MQEITSLRTANSKTYDLGNGIKQLVSSVGYIHYWDTRWKDIDLTIIPCDLFEFEYYCYKNNFIAYFNDATDVVNFNLASFEIKNSRGDSRWINYKLVNASPSRVEVNENRIKYFDCYDGIDVEYIVTTDKLKELITVRDFNSYRDVKFSIKLNGCYYLKDYDTGDVIFYDDDTNEELYRITAPFAYDSTFNEDSQSYQYGNAEFELGQAEVNNLVYDSIKVIVDHNWLANASFPVTVDPTTTLQVGASANDGYWGDKGNFLNNDPTLYIGNFVGYENRNLFFRVTGVTVPKNATISAAKIQYRANAAGTSTSCNTRIHLNAADNATAPTSNADAESKATTTAYIDWTIGTWASGTWYDSPDIKTAVQEIVNRSGWASGNAMMILHKNNGSSSSSYRVASAYDNASIYAPKLVIEYTEGSPIINITVNAVVATSTSALVNPSIQAIRNISISSVLATATSNAINPTVSAIKNVSIASPVSTSATSSIDPTVNAIRNVSIGSVVSTANTIFIEPTLQTIRNVNIQSVTANCVATAIEPTVSSIQNVSITSAISTANVDGIAPTIQTTRTGNILAVVATSNVEAFSPTIDTIRNTSIESVVATGSALFNNPSLSVGGSADITAGSLASSAEFINPMVVAVKNIQITSDAINTDAELIAPVVVAVKNSYISVPVSTVVTETNNPVVSTGSNISSGLIEVVSDFKTPTVLAIQNVSILSAVIDVAASANVPTLDIGGSISISAGLLTAQGMFETPTVNTIRNISLNVPVTGIVCEALSPIVSTSNDIQILCEVIDSVVGFNIPDVLAVKNINIQSTVFTSQAEIIVPQIVVASNVSITSEVIVASALLLEPTVVSGSDINIQCETINVSGQIIAPTIYTVRNAIILPNCITSNAIFIAPSVETIDLRKVSIEVSCHERTVLLDALRYKGHVLISNHEREVELSIEERELIMSESSRRVDLSWLS
jgi:hypothetical protein